MTEVAEMPSDLSGQSAMFLVNLTSSELWFVPNRQGGATLLDSRKKPFQQEDLNYAYWLAHVWIRWNLHRRFKVKRPPQRICIVLYDEARRQPCGHIHYHLESPSDWKYVPAAVA